MCADLTPFWSLFLLGQGLHVEILGNQTLDSEIGNLDLHISMVDGFREPVK